MQVTNRIRDKIKFLESILISAFTYLSTQTYQVLITNSYANTFFPAFSLLLQEL